MKKGYVEMHCHPALKPFGKSFKTNTPGANSTNRRHKHSVWHQSTLTFIKRLTNRIFTLTKFTQTDLTTVYESGSRVMIVSLYPLERPFVDNKLGNGLFSRLLTNLAMGVSQKRIKYVQQMEDYFPDLENEYKFYLQINNRPIAYNDKEVRFSMPTNFNEIKQAQDNTIYVLLSIEGGHAFGTGINIKGRPLDENKILERVRWLKGIPHKPLFVTLAHHFYNELCGQTESLGGMPSRIANQRKGLNTGFTALGEKVMRLLLDKSVGNRILIDIKHMSVDSRKRFYTVRSAIGQINNENIPIVVSHGAANGMRSFNDHSASFPDRAQYLMRKDINFYDDELVLIARSKGVFGIQLDERRVASKKGLKKSNSFFNKKKRRSKKAFLVWRQIEHIAEVLDTKGMPCWDIQTIGSDFDGVVDPINEYWTAGNINLLKQQLLPHAENYLRNRQFNNLNNKIGAEKLLDKVFTDNAMRFIEINFANGTQVFQSL